MKTGLVLFAHGSRDATWREPFENLAAHIRKQASHLRVELAFLEIMQPSLPDVIDKLTQEGIHNLVVAPIFLAQGGHVRHDLPQLLANAQQAYPQLQIRLLPAIGEIADLIAAMANWLIKETHVGT